MDENIKKIKHSFFFGMLNVVSIENHTWKQVKGFTEYSSCPSCYKPPRLLFLKITHSASNSSSSVIYELQFPFHGQTE